MPHSASATNLNEIFQPIHKGRKKDFKWNETEKINKTLWNCILYTLYSFIYVHPFHTHEPRATMLMIFILGYLTFSIMNYYYIFMPTCASAIINICFLDCFFFLHNRNGIKCNIIYFHTFDDVRGGIFILFRVDYVKNIYSQFICILFSYIYIFYAIYAAFVELQRSCHWRHRHSECRTLRWWWERCESEAAEWCMNLLASRRTPHTFPHHCVYQPYENMGII